MHAFHYTLPVKSWAWWDGELFYWGEYTFPVFCLETYVVIWLTWITWIGSDTMSISHTSPELLISGEKNYGYAMVPGMKNLAFWFRTWPIKRASLAVCVYYPLKRYFCGLEKLPFGFPLCRWLADKRDASWDGQLRAHTTKSPRVCANTDQRGGKSMTLKWQIPLYLHLQWLSGQEKESVNVLSKMTLTFKNCF